MISLISLMKEFNDNFFNCPFGDESSPACTPYSGSYIMDQLSIPRSYVTTGCLALLGFVLFFILTTWIFLRFFPVRVSLTKQVYNSELENRNAEVIYINGSENHTKVSIHVRDLNLWIEKRGLNKRSERHILQRIHADFKPGMLNVIMGPSGTFPFVMRFIYKVLGRVVC